MIRLVNGRSSILCPTTCTVSLVRSRALLVVSRIRSYASTPSPPAPSLEPIDEQIDLVAQALNLLAQRTGAFRFRLAIGHFRYFLLSPVPDSVVAASCLSRGFLTTAFDSIGLPVWRSMLSCVAVLLLLHETTSVGDEPDLTP